MAEYEARRSKNTRFSRRAFAALLQVSSGRLHEIMKGQHPITLKMAKKIIAKLTFDEKKADYFLRLVESEAYLRVDGRKRVRPKSTRLLSEDEFALVSDWEYFALMALAETATFRSDIPWLAKKLGISEKRAAEVVAHLLKQGLFNRDEAGRFKNTYTSMTTLIDIPSEVVRKANIECIRQAIENVDRIDVMKRDVSSLTLPVDMERISEVKALIREFKSKVTALMAKEQTTEVYNLNIQFIPVSEIGI
ncbi:TIGR02147 family protein [Bdellovibrio sp. HCB185ZH]|uniref:TIGR02147 family protein n=1 Tax=Bdellovibrio sp. HCB185ZH TaxID=3394235 RepID=UPI0039A714C2